MEKSIKFIKDNTEYTGTLSTALSKEKLYGKQVKVPMKDNIELEKKYLTEDGTLISSSDYSNVQFDANGSVYDNIQHTRDGQVVPKQESSFTLPRPITVAKVTDLAYFVEKSTYPITFTVKPEPGIYSTEFTYHNSANVQEAFLDVRADGPSFLRIGKKANVAPVGINVLSSIFDDDTEEAEEEEISFGF